MKNLNSIRVIVVDDLDSFRECMRDLLIEIGIKNIVESFDGEDAWNKILIEAKGTDSFDLIISDINMPRMTGIDLLKQVRAFKKTNPTSFVLVSTENEQEIVFTALGLGISDYLIKPWQKAPTKEKLLKVLHKIINAKN